MQRRAAAMYAAFFIVIAAGAYSMIAVADSPTISLQDPDIEAFENQQVMIDGREYTVGQVADATNEGQDTRSAELTWVNETARHTETWDNGSTVTLDSTDYRLATAPNATPPSAALREERTLNESLSTVDANGTTYVVVERDGERSFVPRSDYLDQEYGPAEVRSVELGDEFEYQNETVTVASITEAAVVLEWRAPRELSVSASQGGNVTIQGTRYTAHFPDNSTIQLTTDTEAYLAQAQRIDTYNERISGLWGISILSSLGAITLIAIAYIPSRY